MPETTQKRYSIRLSKTPIFWTTNSINHPAKELWESDYLPTFTEVPDSNTPINWVNSFNLTTILDSQEYTMLELTDSLANEKLYFLASNTTKKLANGFELVFKMDIYLSYGKDFYEWLKTKKLQINVNRFLNQTLLKEWFKQQKFLQQDDLLDYKNGTAIAAMTDSNFMAMKIEQLDVNNFISGNPTINYTYEFGKTGSIVIDKSVPQLIFALKSGNDYIPNEIFNTPLFHVYQNTNGDYYCWLQASTSGNAYADISLQYNGMTKDNNRVNVDLGSINTYMKKDFWVNKFVGIFTIPFWRMITDWVIIGVYGDNTKPRILGFRISRIGYRNLYNQYYKSKNQNLLPVNPYNTTYCSTQFQSIGDKKLNYVFPIVQSSVQIRDAALQQDPKLRLKPNPTEEQLVNGPNLQCNAYLVSQVRKPNSTIQYSPYPFSFDFAFNGFITFDGNKFNLINSFQNSPNLINEGLGTMNVATNAYDAYLAQVKPQMNTNLEIAKNNMNLAKQQNDTNFGINMAGQVLNWFQSGIQGIANFFGGKATPTGSGGNSALSAIGSVNNYVYSNANIQNQYYNYQRTYDAQLASARLSSTATNISSSGTTDDSNIKYLVRNQITQDIPAGSIFKPNGEFICYFPNNINDIAFCESLIWKNGIVGNFVTTTDIAFTDENVVLSNGEKLNKFTYLDFSIDEDYLRLWKPNLPVEILEAIKLVNNNSIRLWYEKMDINNLPDFVTDYQGALGLSV